MRNKIFRQAVKHGEGYRFTYKGILYEVIDNVLIYDVTTDDTYILYVDF